MVALEKSFVDDFDGFLGAIEQAGFAGGADGFFDVRLQDDFFALGRRALALRIGNGAPGAGIETDAAFDAEKGINVEPDLELPGDRMLRAFLGAASAADAVVSNPVWHEVVRVSLSENVKMRNGVMSSIRISPEALRMPAQAGPAQATSGRDGAPFAFAIDKNAIIETSCVQGLFAGATAGAGTGRYA